MGIHIEGIENVYIFIFIVLIGQGWQYIEKNYLDSYSCPAYCKVDHDHDMEISGRFTDTRELRDTCSSSDSLRIFHLETESVDSE